MSTRPSPLVALVANNARFREALRPLFVRLVELGAAFSRHDRALHSERNRQMHTAYRARARRRTRSHR